jgi:NAD(P)-dependent dehydrogenase (short-subunit alcohol dehydrogenase family)
VRTHRAMKRITMEFENKVVLITGGGGGIGKAAARRFLEEGASVVLNSRGQEVLDAAKKNWTR